MIASNLWLIENGALNGMAKRGKSQSISVSEAELEAFKDLGSRLRMFPAAMVRKLFYRGLESFLKDGRVHARETDAILFAKCLELLKSDADLTVVRPVRGEDSLTLVRDTFDRLEDPARREQLESEIAGLVRDFNESPKKKADDLEDSGTVRKLR